MLGNNENIIDENINMVKPFFKTQKDNTEQINLDGNIVELQKSLVKRYIVPPFSVLDTRQGYWQNRKKAWLSLGIQSEIGRNDGLTWGNSRQMKDINFYKHKARCPRGAAPLAAPPH